MPSNTCVLIYLARYVVSNINNHFLMPPILIISQNKSLKLELIAFLKSLYGLMVI